MSFLHTIFSCKAMRGAAWPLRAPMLLLFCQIQRQITLHTRHSGGHVLAAVNDGLGMVYKVLLQHHREQYRCGAVGVEGIQVATYAPVTLPVFAPLTVALTASSFSRRQSARTVVPSEQYWLCTSVPKNAAASPFAASGFCCWHSRPPVPAGYRHLRQAGIGIISTGTASASASKYPIPFPAYYSFSYQMLQFLPERLPR